MTDDAWDAWLRDPVTGELRPLWKQALEERKRQPPAKRKRGTPYCGKCELVLPCPCTGKVAAPARPAPRSRSQKADPPVKILSCLGCHRPRRFWAYTAPDSAFCPKCLGSVS
jgi:hypothetical protein